MAVVVGGDTQTHILEVLVQQVVVLVQEPWEQEAKAKGMSVTVLRVWRYV